MTNEEQINFGNISKNTLDNYFNNESKIDLNPSIFHALKRNVRAISPIKTGFEDIQKDGQEAFMKIEKIDKDRLNDEVYLKEVNLKLQAYRAIPENIQAEIDYLKEESKTELFKISIEDLDSCILPVELSNYFEKYMVK
jgi:hypothetical protein